MTEPGKPVKPLRGVIFDLDGTLVDSQLDFAAIRRETGFPQGIGLLEYMASLTCEQARSSAMATIHRHEMAGAAMATWMPGARELMLGLTNANIPVGIVTRNSREAAEHTAAVLSMPTVDLLARDDAPPKPNPAGLLQLAQGWNINAEELVYVGDFLYDLQAAQQAGMRSALYLSSKNRHYADQADIQFEHFDELGLLLTNMLHIKQAEIDND